MTLYIGRESSKLWKRICAEVITEINLLAANWKYLLAGLFVRQEKRKLKVGSGTRLRSWFDIVRTLREDYIHGLAARGVHYIHRPGPTLQDAGFFLLPELGQDRAYISETLFSFIFLSFVLWTFHPFIFKSKKIYTVLLWCRVLAFLVASQFLRIITFYSTQLPGPNYHCREAASSDSVFEVLLINFPRGVLYGCGDLIFSSHMIFSLVFVRTYQKYDYKAVSLVTRRDPEFLDCGIAQALHGDVVVAWYTVNLVVFFIDKKLAELPDRTNGAASLLLPLSTKDKDSKNKEENHKLLKESPETLLIGFAVIMQRQRTQVNGKTLDDVNTVHVDATMNGA
ncbi:unnamed protein product [Prunus armeniaca]|uniref:Sphingomyelin synthase-like domain-containing protein n=1 Tax=Prunus armeniaca TaxID=36596 RepID=A0A6J5WUX9_PRUAR|nr:unnamed protein product [Prunus armeniaca]